MRYIAGLDGLRALAILLVLLFHAKAPGLPGGNIGVDLFLVLSGFLITSLLLDELGRSGTIQLKRFYLRRAWRLMPALLLLLVIYAICAPFVWPDYYFHARDGVAVLLYVGNLAAAAGTAPEKLLHSWSLGLEEQFYLLWPLVLVAYCKAARRLPLWQALLGLYAFLCLWRFWCLYGQGYTAGLAYYRPDIHASGLVLGAALGAWCRARRSTHVSPLLGCLGWLLILFALIVPQSERAHLSFYVPVAEFGAALLIISIASGGQPLLSAALATHVGKLSYGLYLFHYPIMLYLTENRVHWVIVFCAGGVLAYAAAWLSFNTIEAMARRYRERRLPSAST